MPELSFPGFTDDNDEFGRKPYANSLMDVALELPTTRAVTVGVFGPWGSGKTRFLQMMKESATDSSTATTTIQFQPWRYERRQDVAPALVAAILRGLVADQKRVAQLVKRVFKVIAISPLAAGRSSSFSLIPGVAVDGVKLIASFTDAFAQADAKYQQEIETLIDEVGKRVSTLANGKRVILFVDDLDRCLPDRMIRILEAVHLFLSEIPIITVLAVDRDAIEFAVRQRYGASQLGGARYLDKIVDIPFSLSLPSDSQLEARYGLALNGHAVLRGTLTKQFTRLGLLGNPRMWERFAAQQIVVRKIPAVEKLVDPDDDLSSALALLGVLHTRFPELYRVVLSAPNGLRSFAEVTYTSVVGQTSEVRLQRGVTSAYVPFVRPESEEYVFFSRSGDPLKTMLDRVGNRLESLVWALSGSSPAN